MNIYSLFLKAKDNLFNRNKKEQTKLENVLQMPELGKRKCTSCNGEINACVVNGKQLTKRQAYNKFKAISPDGKIRCQACMIKWLEDKINECI